MSEKSRRPAGPLRFEHRQRHCPPAFAGLSRFGGSRILIGSGARLRVTPQIFDILEKDYAGYINLARNLSFSPQAGDDVIREITGIKLSCPPEVAAGDFRACDKFDVMERLGEIKHRVLIISGGDDKLTPPKYADYLEKNIRLATRCHLEGAGHMMPNEKPDEVNRAIRSFLQSLERG